MLQKLKHLAFCGGAEFRVPWCYYKIEYTQEIGAKRRRKLSIILNNLIRRRTKHTKSTFLNREGCRSWPADRHKGLGYQTG